MPSRVDEPHKPIGLIVSPNPDRLDEFRCTQCGSLLLKGRNLEKSFFQVRCRKCKILVDSMISMQ